MIEITNIQIKVINKDKLKAYARITLDDSFVITGVKIVNGQKGLFVAMPSRKGSDEKYYDICFPATTESHELISKAILSAYQEQSGDESPANEEFEW